ncbi:MAG: hypothetical protein AAB214_16625 [Fibrobacterota bacterium]
MKKLALLATPLFALGLMSCGSSNDSPSTTAPAAYTDVSAANLTTSDKAFLAKLQSASSAFGAISQSTKRDNKSTGAVGARKLDLFDGTCASPRILHEEFWELGDSTVDSTTVGARRFVVDDTTTTYDAITGADITCDYEAMFNATGGTREVFRQAMVEGDLLTTSMSGTSLSKTNYVDSTWEITFSMKGKVRYKDGFTLTLDSAYDRMVMKMNDFTSEPAPTDLYYHVIFDGYPYSAVLRYNKTLDAIQGDIVRGGERIGTMRVYRDDRMEVLDLDGKAITP